MANVVTHAQSTTKTWRRQHEAIRTSVKELNDIREVSGPMPISITVSPSVNISPVHWSLNRGLEETVPRLDLSSSRWICLPVGEAVLDYHLLSLLWKTDYLSGPTAAFFEQSNNLSLSPPILKKE